jgi:hypothetical protein
VSWTWVAIAVVVSVIYGLTSPKPGGTRPIGQTRLIAVARIVLLLVVLALFYKAFFRGN